jgi:hypothetical protein
MLSPWQSLAKTNPLRIKRKFNLLRSCQQKSHLFGQVAFVTELTALYSEVLKAMLQLS